MSNSETGMLSQPPVLLRRKCTLDEFDSLDYSDMHEKVSEFIYNYAEPDSIVVCELNDASRDRILRIYQLGKEDFITQYRTDESDAVALFGKRRFELAVKYGKPLTLAISL